MPLIYALSNKQFIIDFWDFPYSACIFPSNEQIFHLISGISSLSYAGGGKNSSLMQKKSVFTIAYDDMASSNIQPPSSANGVPAKEEQKLIN